MTWSKSLQVEVIREFADAQRLKGTAMTDRDDPRPRVDVAPFEPAEVPSEMRTEDLVVVARPLSVPEDDQPVEYGNRRVVVEAPPIRKPRPKQDAGAPCYRPPRREHQRRPR